MVEILQDHITDHVVPNDKKWAKRQSDAAEELVGLLRTYLK